MKMRFCPSCKKKVSTSAKKCPNCGLMISTESHARMSRIVKAASIAAIIVILAICVVLFRVLEHDRPLTAHNSSEKIETESQTETIKDTHSSGIIRTVTLKDIHGTEFTPDYIMDRFNSFMMDEGDESLSINELVHEPGEMEDIYHDIKNNDNISISIFTPKNDAAATSVSVSARSGNPEAFIKYCFALMSIFNPTMKADVRQHVLYKMIGYTESGDTPLNDKNTYIIVRTKYIFTNSESNGLNMLIEQMPPPLEVDSGKQPPLLPRQ